MKLFISLVLVLTSWTAFAASEKHAEGHGEGKAHHDWNAVKLFKQPEANASLAIPPASTEILEPKFNSEIKGTETVLKWKPVEGAKYHLQVATDPNYKWLVVNEALVDYTEYTVKNLQPGTQYFWRVYTQKPSNMKAHTKGAAVSSEFEVL